MKSTLIKLLETLGFMLVSGAIIALSVFVGMLANHKYVDPKYVKNRVDLEYEYHSIDIPQGLIIENLNIHPNQNELYLTFTLNNTTGNKWSSIWLGVDIVLDDFVVNRCGKHILIDDFLDEKSSIPVVIKCDAAGKKLPESLKFVPKVESGYKLVKK